MNTVFRKGIRYWNTLRYLKYIQITGRILQYLRRTKVDLSEFYGTSALSNNWTQPAKRNQRMVEKNAFCFLNETHEIASLSDWNNIQWTKLWLYNLHYFDDLVANDANKRASWHCSLIQRWINENPPGEGNGWEPYPSSLRIVNWIKWTLGGNNLEDSWKHSLAIQIRYLSKNLETHLLGNHLFANAKALLFAGLFFRGVEAEHWYQIGLKIVKRELPEQVLSDGGHFELSTMYHMIFLEDLLDLVNIHRAYGKDLPSGVEARILAMFNWLNTMCHPDGEISLFNDAAFGVTPSVREIQDYGTRLFPSLLLTGKNKQDGLTTLDDSGYRRAVMGDAVALIDQATVGPSYIPAHAHADTLSFELSLYRQRVIVNSGTSVYGINSERHLQRSTISHATVTIDGEDSSEVWGGFRVARRAKVFNFESDVQESRITLSACHDGYRRLYGKPVHCRTWQLSKDSLIIDDQIMGKGMHEVDVVFPLHPDIRIVTMNGSKVILNVSEKQVEIDFEGDGILSANKSIYHPEFGASIENQKLFYQLSEQLPVRITTKIRW